VPVGVPDAQGHRVPGGVAAHPDRQAAAPGPGRGRAGEAGATAMNRLARQIVIVDGVRTPFLKAGTVARELPAYELGRQALVALMAKLNLKPDAVDEVVIGCVGNPPEAANVARVIALRAGVDRRIPARTVSRNCASGMESI